MVLDLRRINPARERSTGCACEDFQQAAQHWRDLSLEEGHDIACFRCCDPRLAINRTPTLFSRIRDWLRALATDRRDRASTNPPRHRIRISRHSCKCVCAGWEFQVRCDCFDSCYPVHTFQRRFVLFSIPFLLHIGKTGSGYFRTGFVMLRSHWGRKLCSDFVGICLILMSREIPNGRVWRSESMSGYGCLRNQLSLF